jgi:hypothetical protein
MTTRQEILQAIKRTAVGGRALGGNAFSSATGIKEHEWRKHWTRWNQALVEAGFPPNTLTPKYADEVLGTSLAELARSLGSVPVKGDIDHEKAADPTFPGYEAFRRWKSSGTLAAALHRFCADRADLADVVAMCASRVAAAPPARTAGRAKVVNGYVYLKRYGRSGRDYKLGKTEDLRRRHAQLESMYPGELRHVHSIPTDDAAGIERYWRTRFEGKRLPTKGPRGEIFRLDPEDVSAFRSRDYQ